MLDRLVEIMGGLPWDKVEGGTVFIELDEVTYGEFMKEVEEKVGNSATAKENVADIGKSIRLNLNGKNFIIATNKRAKDKLDTMYVAFKTKIDGRVQDNSGS